MDSLTDIFSGADELAAAIQDARLKVVMANQQVSDVSNDRWTPGALIARWENMSESARAGFIALVSSLFFIYLSRGK